MIGRFLFAADAEETISDLDESKIYIIGGIVDRNRFKVCLIIDVSD